MKPEINKTRLSLLCICEAMAEIHEGRYGRFSVGFAGDTFNTANYFKRTAGAACRIAGKGGALVAFDSNYRPRLWTSRKEAFAAMDAFWEQTDIALPSIDDEMAIRGRHALPKTGDDR